MDIAILASKLDSERGGSNISLHLISNYLVERGHKVKIITFNPFGENNTYKDYHYEIETHPTKPSKLVYEIPKKLSEIDNKYDIFHIFEPLLAPFGGIYKKMGGSTPIVCRLNAYSMFCSNAAEMDGECHKNCSMVDKFIHDNVSLKSKISRTPYYIARNYAPPALVNNIDLFFAISPQVKEAYIENGIKRDKIEVVPNFYDPGFSLAENPKSSIPKDTKNILFVGRLRDEKGVDILMESLEKVSEINRVDIVGDGQHRSELQEDSKSYEQEIYFHGWVDHKELPQYYNDSDIFVHAGRWPEPFGRTILEALQYQCAPVVSDIGAPPWVSGEAGETFRNKDYNDLAKSLNHIAEDEILSEKKARCKSRLSKFEPNRIVDIIEEKYFKLINK